ncbi:hypothetical protein [Vulcanisaeta sp. JCM 16159]|uniref:hypothetical protein n=1 Tax=Vulcanisaeta sp. JCM 16159 TaxID=1295371 RepID=UPI001FB4C687|nr:hypothetical protein [Vulcanisaeta sp. JCM 16159]
MGKYGKSRDGRVPAVDVTMVGIDVGVRHSVMAFVGKWAKLLSDLAVIYARQNGVSLVPLGMYDAMTRAYVVEVNYPGVDRYRGNELTSSVISKALSAVVRAAHSVQRFIMHWLAWRLRTLGGLVGISVALPGLGRFGNLWLIGLAKL